MANTKICTSCRTERKEDQIFFRIQSIDEKTYFDVCRLCEAETSHEKAKVRQSWEQAQKGSENTKGVFIFVAVAAALAVGVYVLLHVPRGIVLAYRDISSVIASYIEWVFH